MYLKLLRLHPYLSVSSIRQQFVLKTLNVSGKIDFYLDTGFFGGVLGLWFFFPKGSFSVPFWRLEGNLVCSSYHKSHHQRKLQSKHTFAQFFHPTYSEYTSVCGYMLQRPLPPAQLPSCCGAACWGVYAGTMWGDDGKACFCVPLAGEFPCKRDAAGKIWAYTCPAFLLTVRWVFSDK